MYENCRTTRADPPRPDLAAHAAALGCTVFTATTGAELATAYRKAKAAATNHPAVVVVATSPTTWTESGAWWEVGVPETLPGSQDKDQEKQNQVRYLSG
jgi:3D-(3,5/4)-trihydroxycyclohexane-1,2-dione acylhydrolase (decyclizing)